MKTSKFDADVLTSARLLERTESELTTTITSARDQQIRIMCLEELSTCQQEKKKDREEEEIDNDNEDDNNDNDDDNDDDDGHAENEPEDRDVKIREREEAIRALLAQVDTKKRDPFSMTPYTEFEPSVVPHRFSTGQNGWQLRNNVDLTNYFLETDNDFSNHSRCVVFHLRLALLDITDVSRSAIKRYKVNMSEDETRVMQEYVRNNRPFFNSNCIPGVCRGPPGQSFLDWQFDETLGLVHITQVRRNGLEYIDGEVLDNAIVVLREAARAWQVDTLSVEARRYKIDLDWKAFSMEFVEK
jgi:hypothetical protein